MAPSREPDTEKDGDRHSYQKRVCDADASFHHVELPGEGLVDEIRHLRHHREDEGVPLGGRSGSPESFERRVGDVADGQMTPRPHQFDDLVIPDSGTALFR